MTTRPGAKSGGGLSACVRYGGSRSGCRRDFGQTLELVGARASISRRHSTHMSPSTKGDQVGDVVGAVEIDPGVEHLHERPDLLRSGAEMCESWRIESAADGGRW